MKAGVVTSPMPRRVLSVGYVVLDVLIHERGIGHSAGGTAGNVAANLSYFGWESSLAALYGDDPAGSHLKADLKRAGVSTRNLLRRTDMTTPVVIHEVNNGSHRFKFGCPECGRKFSKFHAIPRSAACELMSAEPPDVLFLDRVSSAAIILAKHVRGSGGMVVFEPSIPSDSRRFRELLHLAHIVKVSSDRLDMSSPLLEHATPLQIYTAAAEGSFWRKNGGRWKHVRGCEISVIDAGGAGDWMTAALLASMPSIAPSELADIDFEAPLGYAQAVAAVSCQVLGARGLSSAVGREDLDAIVELLLGQPRQISSSRSHRPSKSRRRAACSACLARRADNEVVVG